MVAQLDDIDYRRLHNELEHAVKSINREAISSLTGPISKSQFTDVASMVASLRARYLQTVIKLGSESRGTCIETESALELKRLREAYTEAIEGYSALEHALSRGYVGLQD